MAKKAAKHSKNRGGSAKKQTRTGKQDKPATSGTVSTLVRGTVAGAIAAVSNRLPGGVSEPDAIDMLEREHRELEAILEQGEETTERARKTRRELLDRLTALLNAHELMEEKVLYPALQSHPQARDIVLEGYEEHHVADLIVAELHKVATDDEAWGAKFKVLKENIEHHIEEEEGEMFRLARGIFSRDELRELGERMQAVRPA